MDELGPPSTWTDEHGYKGYGSKEKCYFCDRPANNIFRIPKLRDFSTGTHTEDRRAYRVCLKCLARCIKVNGTHNDLWEYAAALERGGAKQGRPSTGLVKAVTVDLRKLMTVLRQVRFTVEGREGRLQVQAMLPPGDDGVILVVLSDEELSVPTLGSIKED